MAPFRRIFIAVALTGLVVSGSALAQSPAIRPSTTDRPAAAKAGNAADGGGIAATVHKDWDGLSTMTRRQWASMKVKWVQEKVKWTACNRQVRAQKLSAAKRWTAVGKCMMP